MTADYLKKEGWAVSSTFVPFFVEVDFWGELPRPSTSKHPVFLERARTLRGAMDRGRGLGSCLRFQRWEDPRRDGKGESSKEGRKGERDEARKTHDSLLVQFSTFPSTSELRI